MSRELMIRQQHTACPTHAQLCALADSSPTPREVENCVWIASSPQSMKSPFHNEEPLSSFRPFFLAPSVPLPTFPFKTLSHNLQYLGSKSPFESQHESHKDHTSRPITMSNSANQKPAPTTSANKTEDTVTYFRSSPEILEPSRDPYDERNRLHLRCGMRQRRRKLFDNKKNK
jgi:hypothetical protein